MQTTFQDKPTNTIQLGGEAWDGLGGSGSSPFLPERPEQGNILTYEVFINNSMAYGTRRFNAAFTRALQ